MYIHILLFFCYTNVCYTENSINWLNDLRHFGIVLSHHLISFIDIIRWKLILLYCKLVFLFLIHIFLSFEYLYTYIFFMKNKLNRPAERKKTRWHTGNIFFHFFECELNKICVLISHQFMKNLEWMQILAEIKLFKTYMYQEYFVF